MSLEGEPRPKQRVPNGEIAQLVIGAQTESSVPTPDSLSSLSQQVRIKEIRVPKTSDNAEDPSALDRLTKLAAVSKTPGLKVRAELRGDGKVHTLTTSEAIIPAGAITEQISPEQKTQDTVKSWYRVEGKALPWVMEGAAAELPKGDRSIPVDRVLSTRPGKPYGIVVEGTVINSEAIGDLGDNISTELDNAHPNRTTSPKAEYAKPYLAKRYAETQVGLQSGMSELVIAVGMENSKDAQALAYDIAAAALAPDKDYSFSPNFGTEYTSADEAIAARTGLPPLYVSSAVLARTLPIPERDMPGIPRVERHIFSTNILNVEKIPETHKVEIGVVLDAYGEPGVPFVRNKDTLIEQQIVAGATRSGKSIAVEQDLAQTIISGEKAGEPVGAIILSPKVGDDDYGERFAAMLKPYKKDVTYITIGDLDAPAIHINPLEPKPGETIRDRQDKIVSFFTNAHAAAGQYDAEMGRFFAQYLKEAVYGYDNSDGTRFESVFEEKGYDPKLNESDYKGGNDKWPNIKDLRRKGMNAILAKDYPGDGSRSHVLWGSYFDSITSGVVEDFLSDEGASIDFKKLGKSVTVFKLDRVTDPMQRSLIEILIIDGAVHEAERVKRELPPGTPNRIRQNIVLEEAQDTIPKDSPAAAAVDKILQKGASAGVGVTAVYQNPDLASSILTGNAGSILVFRLQEGIDIDRMETLLGITPEQASELMKPEQAGRAAYRASGTGDAVLVQIDAPPPWPENPIELLGVEEIAHYEEGEVPYTWVEMRRGDKFLKTKAGTTVQLWADNLTLVTAVGLNQYGPRDTNTDIAQLREMRSGDDPDERRRLDYAIRKAAKAAVNTRSPMILREMPREPVIEFVEGKIKADLDGKVYLGKVPPLQAYTAVRAKAKAYDEIYTSLKYAHLRSDTDDRLIEVTAALETITTAEKNAEGEEKMKKAGEINQATAELERLTKTAEALDNSGYDVYRYDVEKQAIAHFVDHPAHKYIENATRFQPSDLDELLLADNHGDYTINRVLPQVGLYSAIKEGKKEEWLNGYAEKLQETFDMNDKTLYTLIGEHDAFIDRHTEKRPNTQPEPEENAQSSE